MELPPKHSRRELVAEGAAAVGGLLLAGCAGGKLATGPAGAQRPSVADEVLPVEDLMREHGVLRRVLLVYEEAARRLDAAEPLPPAALPGAAEIVRKMIEQYHEVNEETYVFPSFRQAGRLTDLVDVLTAQHAAGRKLTTQITRLGAFGGSIDDSDRRDLSAVLRQFVRMYAPHAAREDTVLFVAFRELVKGRRYEELGDVFEGKERQVLGPGGFEDMVARVAAIERSMGIHDLSQFTPKT